MTPKQDVEIDMEQIEKVTMPSLTWKIWADRAGRGCCACVVYRFGFCRLCIVISRF